LTECQKSANQQGDSSKAKFYKKGNYTNGGRKNFYNPPEKIMKRLKETGFTQSYLSPA
jgi:hypothetical protein